jgi:hypothetical protein
VRRLAAVVFLLMSACGGDAARTVVIPTVAAGDYEAACADLCAPASGDTLCTAKHAEFCVARCRVVTRDLPQACAACLLAAGTHIEGYTNSFGDSYCTVGGPAELGSCEAECDDAGAAPAAPEMETLCQLTCAFYMQDPTPLACSADASAECLDACRATATGQGRVCAQCTIEQVSPGRICINDECDCLNRFPAAAVCTSLCDSAPP